MTRTLLVLFTLGAVLTLMGLAAWSIDRMGYARGVAVTEGLHALAASKTQAAIDLRDQAGAATRVSILDMLRLTIPPIEVRTHDTVEVIRQVYIDRPLPPGACIRPDGVLDQLNKARDSANATIGAVRP